MARPAVELIQEGEDITTTLTETEAVLFGQCEEVIKNGLSTFLAVGQALAEIRDNRLYRVTHKTFEGYCREVWDISKGKVYQQISGYETVILLKEKSQQLLTFSESNLEQAESASINKEKHQQKPRLPINEAQTRPLTKLSPENKIKAWELVLEQLNDDKPLTAALVKKAVREVCGEVVQKTFKDIKEKVESTQLVSKLFKTQYNILLQIIYDERNNQWKSMKKTEVVKHLKELIKIVESDD